MPPPLMTAAMQPSPNAPACSCARSIAVTSWRNAGIAAAAVTPRMPSSCRSIECQRRVKDSGDLAASARESSLTLPMRYGLADGALEDARPPQPHPRSAVTLANAVVPISRYRGQCVPFAGSLSKLARVERIRRAPFGSPAPLRLRRQARCAFKRENNHARAACHSRSTLATEIPSVWPVSLRESPPKNLSSATWLFRESNVANSVSAPSRSSTSTSTAPCWAIASTSDTRAHWPDASHFVSARVVDEDPAHRHLRRDADRTDPGSSTCRDPAGPAEGTPRGPQRLVGCSVALPRSRRR